MSGYECPYCNKVFFVASDTFRNQCVSFENNDQIEHRRVFGSYNKSAININFYRCPGCNKYTIFAEGVGSYFKDSNTSSIIPIAPQSSAKQYPDYIPEAIRNDYEEACTIVNLSPKASATLSRRCLQGMIHDYWNIKSKNLHQEITALKDKISPDLWSAIDSLRELGNIGAHMEKDTNMIVDIDPDEANSLIKLIELLIKEWYINREDRKNLITGIKSINDVKQGQRKKTE